MIHSIKYDAPLIALALLLAACSVSGEEPEERTVMATVYPLAYFTERIAGDLVVVQTLIKPGMEAHDFEPTASDVRRIARADIVVANGLALESWMDDAIKALGADAPAVVVEASDTLISGGALLASEEERHEEEAEELDPHVWLDPTYAVLQAERIRDALGDADPANRERYHDNAAALIADLRALHDSFTDGLASCRHGAFVTSHAAYGYLAARYDLKQIPIAGLASTAGPSPQRLAEIVDEVNELDLGYVLVEPIVGDRLAQTVRRETGVELAPIHAIESVTQSEFDEHGHYLGLMRDNLASLKLALECSS